VIHGEVAENVLRQDFRPSEMVAIAGALEPILRREAKARQGMRTDLRENFPDVDGGRARDKLGKYVGVHLDAGLVRLDRRQIKASEEPDSTTAPALSAAIDLSSQPEKLRCYESFRVKDQAPTFE
jgi:hypothetical protein